MKLNFLTFSFQKITLKIIFFSLLFLNFFQKNVFSQTEILQKKDSISSKENTKDKTNTKDTIPHVESFYNNICVTSAIISRDFSISIQHPNRLRSPFHPTADYSTVLPVAFGLALDYKWLSLEYSLALPLNQQPSWQRSFRTGITGKKIWAKTFWQEYRGLANNAIDSLRNPNISNFRQDIYAQMFYFRVMYAFNKNTYSHLASLFQVDRQKKSAGTWALGLSYTKNFIQADSALVQYEQNPAQKSPLDVVRVGSGLVSLQGGYAHTFVFKEKWFIHFSLFPAISMQRNHVKYADGTTRRFNLVFGFNNEFQTTLGYNDDNFFAGIKVQNLSFIDNLDENSFYDYGLTQFRLFVGFRLPKKYRLFF